MEPVRTDYKICPVCGKKFYIPVCSEWAYKRKVKDKVIALCTYGCARTVDKGPAVKRNRGDGY